MSRYSGKTTRLIDAAIQHLFTTGELVLLHAREVSELLDGKTVQSLRGHNKETVYAAKSFIEVSFAHTTRYIDQDYFIRAFERRLYSEHLGSFTIEGNCYRVINKNK